MRGDSWSDFSRRLIAGLGRSVFVLLNECIEVTAVEVNSATDADNGQFLLENEMLHGLFAPTKVNTSFFDGEECGLHTRRWNSDEKALEPDSHLFSYRID